MTKEEDYLRERHFARIRWTKWLLRPLPRRAMLHRYPFLKRFAAMARRRSYLWSFRSRDVVPALYAGWVLTCVPLYGVQVASAFVLALVLRANLPVLVGLQLISNPLTVPVIYTTAYFTGDFILDLTGGVAPPREMPLSAEDSGLLMKSMGIYIRTFIGGALIGYICGFFSSLLYHFFTRRAGRAIARLKELKTKPASPEKEKEPHQPQKA